MVATTEELRELMTLLKRCVITLTYKNILGEEFEALFEDAFELQLEETTLVPVNLQVGWI